MTSEFDTYAKIFVAGESEENLLRRISGMFWVPANKGVVTTGRFSVEVRANKDHKWNPGRQEDFLFWPLQVEMECADGVALDHYVAVTGRLLERFWDAGLSAVAACDFEHLLPWNGGIQSVEMPPPWVEQAGPPLRMRWEWFDELDFLDEFTAKLDGEPFTGYSVDHDRGLGFDVTTVERGQKIGAEYIVDERTGVLREFDAVHYGNIFFGGVYGWDREGNLREETFYPKPGAGRVRRRWDADGRLVSEEALQERLSWNGSYAAVLGDHDPPKHPAFTYLGRIDLDEAEERYVSGGEPYWGFLATAEDGGRGRVRLVLDGREEGPVWEWDRSGELVLQGMLYPGVGKVGPWNEWGAQARLVRQTVFDALGNIIIERRFDEAGHIAHEERFDPVRLWRDPETGEERPAPWLWY